MKLKYLTLILFLFVPGGFAGIHSPEGSSKISFKKMLSNMEKRFARLVDYEMYSNSYSSKRNSKQSETYHLYYKNPGKVRMEILSGKDKGTIMLYDHNGDKSKVKVRAGGKVTRFMQKLFSMEELDVTDAKLHDLRGYGIEHADWGYLIKTHKKMLTNNIYSFENKGVVDFKGKKAYLFIVSSSDPEQSNSIKYSHFLINPRTFFPFQRTEYDKNGKMLKRNEFIKVKFNLDLDDKVFSEI
ncbi:MAG: hypothetical protein ABUK01_03010 [Leptospirales bacterium]